MSMFSKGYISEYRVHNIQRKPGKLEEKFGKFEKSGKAWKTQGNFSENRRTQGKPRKLLNFLSTC